MSKSLSGLTIGNFDVVNVIDISDNFLTTTNINGISDSTLNYISNCSSDVQSQLNTLTSGVNLLNSEIGSITTTTGGGFFNLVCEFQGSWIASSTFSFGANAYNSSLFTYMPQCSLYGIAISAASNVLSNTYFNLSYQGTVVRSVAIETGTKNFVSVSTDQTVFAPINFELASLMQFACGTSTQGGSGGTRFRATLFFQTAGVVGSTPILTMGTTTTLSSGSQSTASITGTATNPILNLGLAQGPNGTNGISPIFAIGPTTTLAAGSQATATITGISSNPVLNLGLPVGAVGATPVFTLGTTTTLPSGSQATATITGTSANPVLSLGLPVGTSMLYLGTWGTSTWYIVDNIVIYNYGAYVCIQNIPSLGMVPNATSSAAYWSLMVSTPNFAIGNVNTVGYGSAAQVQMSGTVANPILNFSIPQGPQGNPGDSIKGDKGDSIQGDKGDKGDAGPDQTAAIIAATASSAAYTTAAIMVYAGIQASVDVAQDATISTIATDLATTNATVSEQGTSIGTIQTTLTNVKNNANILEISGQFQIQDFGFNTKVDIQPNSIQLGEGGMSEPYVNFADRVICETKVSTNNYEFLSNAGGSTMNIGIYEGDLGNPNIVNIATGEIESGAANELNLGNTHSTMTLLGYKINVGSDNTNSNAEIIIGSRISKTKILGETLTYGNSNTETNNIDGGSINIGNSSMNATVGGLKVNIGTAATTATTVAAQVNIGNSAKPVNMFAENFKIGDLTTRENNINGGMINIGNNSKNLGYLPVVNIATTQNSQTLDGNVAAQTNIGNIQSLLILEGGEIRIGPQGVYAFVYLGNLSSTTVIEGRTINIGTTLINGAVNIGNNTTRLILRSQTGQAVQMDSVIDQLFG